MNFLQNLSRKQLLLAVIAIVILLGMGVTAYFYRDAIPGISQEAPVAESEGTETGDINGLPPEPVFTLPEGATAIDEYVFIIDGVVNFRSLIGQKPLSIPTADEESFEKLIEFKTYTANNVESECGGMPIYTYYADANQVYFYQIWRTSFFRTSQVEGVVGARKDNFRVLADGSAVSDTSRFEIGHYASSSTCKLTLNRSDL